jgi:hypothetical protein
MTGTASKTFVVLRSDGTQVEITATRAEQEPQSSRVTFYDGDNQVGSFINVQAWHVK